MSNYLDRQGLCYSETKKKDRSSTPKVGRSALNIAEDDEDLEAESPLEMLRFALLQLSTLEGAVSSVDKTPFHSITSLLQVATEVIPTQQICFLVFLCMCSHVSKYSDGCLSCRSILSSIYMLLGYFNYYFDIFTYLCLFCVPAISTCRVWKSIWSAAIVACSLYHPQLRARAVVLIQNWGSQRSALLAAPLLTRTTKS